MEKIIAVNIFATNVPTEDTWFSKIRRKKILEYALSPDTNVIISKSVNKHGGCPITSQ